MPYPVCSMAGPYLLDSDGAKPFEAAVPLLRCLEWNRTKFTYIPHILHDKTVKDVEHVIL